MGKSEIEQFLNYLVTQRHLSASSQSQALNAIIFMYKHILGIKTEWLDKLVRVKRKKFLPVVLSVSEVRNVLSHMKGIPKLMAELIYGTGLRVNECVQLRIKDIDFELKTITVRQGKGGKDRATLLPEKLIPELGNHLLKVIEMHKTDCLKGAGHVPLPGALYKKYPKASQSIGWQYLFPSKKIQEWPQTQQFVRWYSSPSTPQKAFKKALEKT